MKTGSDADEQTIVCQRPFGKRRRRSKATDIHSDTCTKKSATKKIVLLKSEEASNTAVEAIPKIWIDNSFGLRLPVKDQTCKNVNVDILNNSDLLLAQIDVDELSKSSNNTSFSHKKMTISDSVRIDEKGRKAVGQNKSMLNLSGECDLFDEEDEFSDIFFPKFRASQLNSSPKEEQAYKPEIRSNHCHYETRSCKVKEEFKEMHLNKSNHIVISDNSDGQITQGKDFNVVLEDNLIIKDQEDGSFVKSSKKGRRSNMLKERLKERLLLNTTVTSVNNLDEKKQRQDALAAARVDASQIRKEGTSVDIGPFYGLPSKVEELFRSLRGITSLYDWQNECLSLQAVKDHRNLIYTLPTSGGKTLVAEILIFRELLCHQKDALLLLPFVSIVQEKVRTISEFATELGFLVEEYAGSKGRFPPLKRRKKRSLYIATIEKGHSLINSLIGNERLDSLGLLVVDELHMIGEGGSRGANIESMLLKLLHTEAKIQIIGMSATLNNIKDLQTFLHAEVYSNDFRPVSLQEYVKVDDNIYQVKSAALDPADMLEHSRVALFPYNSECLKRDPDHVLGLVIEVIPEHSCLVFCSTKRNCENVAQLLSELICKYYRHLSQVNKEKRKLLLRQLQQDGNGKICPVLKYTVHFGIAYHHSGLTMDERRLIEEAYLEGTLCVLACTSTLAAGVNLPARRVILRSPYVGMQFIRYSQYKQMTGRAGRAGIDSHGESILITNTRDRLKVKNLLAGPKDFCYSSLVYDGCKGIQSLLLSAIGLKLITTTHSAFQFLERSLLRIQADKLEVDLTAVTKDSLQILIDQELVMQKKLDNDDNSPPIQVTELGNATFKGSIDHVYSCQLYKDLKTAEQSLVLSNHFHLLYLVTPYDAALAVSPAWDIYYNQFSKLSESESHVAKLIGISESYLSRKAVGLSSRQKINTMATNRFFLTLMLWKLWNEASIWDVAFQFSQPRGFIQNLLNQSAAFASSVYHFCLELKEFWAFQDLLANFVKRLSYCVTVELLPLIEIPGVNIARAKQLYSCGLISLACLAAADTKELVAKIEHLSTRQANQIISAAKNLLEEKTTALLEEVETLVSVPNAS